MGYAQREPKSFGTRGKSWLRLLVILAPSANQDGAEAGAGDFRTLSAFMHSHSLTQSRPHICSLPEREDTTMIYGSDPGTDVICFYYYLDI
jgi:hypothetical protein